MVDFLILLSVGGTTPTNGHVRRRLKPLARRARHWWTHHDTLVPSIAICGQHLLYMYGFIIEASPYKLLWQ